MPNSIIPQDQDGRELFNAISSGPKMKSEIPLLKDQVEFRFAQSRFTLSYE